MATSTFKLADGNDEDLNASSSRVAVQLSRAEGAEAISGTSGHQSYILVVPIDSENMTSYSHIFLRRDAMLVRYMLSSCVCVCVCLSVCPSHSGVVSKRLTKPHRYQWTLVF